jgi:hypothetical protein
MGLLLLLLLLAAAAAAGCWLLLLGAQRAPASGPHPSLPTE